MAEIISSGSGISVSVSRGHSDAQRSSSFAGKLDGEKVQVRAGQTPSLIQVLFDNAEEVSRDLASEKRTRTKGEKKDETGVHAKSKKELHDLIAEVAAAEGADMMPDLRTGARLKEFLKRLMEGEHSPEEMLEELADEFQDVSQQYLALRSLQSMEEVQNSRPTLLNNLQSAENKLLEASSRPIVAGLNIWADAKKTATGEDGIQNREKSIQLVNFYRDSVQDDQITHIDLYRNILTKYPDDDFLEKATFLYKAFGADMRSICPSVPMVKERTNGLLIEIGLLKQLVSAHDQCDTLIEEVRRVYKDRQITASVNSVMLDTLSVLCCEWDAASKVDDIVSSLGGDAGQEEDGNLLSLALKDQNTVSSPRLSLEEKNIQHKIFVLNRLQEVARHASDALYRYDVEVKEKVVGIIQDQLDAEMMIEQEVMTHA